MELNYCMSLSHCLSRVAVSQSDQTEKNKVCEVSHRQDNEQEGERGGRGGRGVWSLTHSLTVDGCMGTNLIGLSCVLVLF